MIRSVKSQKKPPALVALERAAKKALELARRTGTPAYVLENGKIVDIAARSRGKRKRQKRGGEAGASK
jgi:hypothetical protein